MNKVRISTVFELEVPPDLYDKLLNKEGLHLFCKHNCFKRYDKTLLRSDLIKEE